VTTVRATGWERGDAQDVALLRAALVAHGNTVLAVVLVGPMLAHQDGSAADTYQDQTAGAATVNEARTTTERLIEAGFDQVGLVQSITQEARLGSHEGLPPVLSADQLQAIVEVAHNQGQWVLGQAVFPEEAQGMLTAGVDEIANWPSSAVPMPEEPIRALVQGSIPVVSGFNVVTPQAGDVRRFLDAGGTLVFGTYGPNAISLASPHKEFLVMQTQGMSATEMIQAATANAAQAIGLGDRVGTLEVGKQADMIVVDGDPLADFGVMEQVIYVVKGGELAVQPESD
jgi:imidazolonepropionase-like amidohydrolase